MFLINKTKILVSLFLCVFFTNSKSETIDVVCTVTYLYKNNVSTHAFSFDFSSRMVNKANMFLVDGDLIVFESSGEFNTGRPTLYEYKINRKSGSIFISNKVGREPLATGQCKKSISDAF